MKKFFASAIKCYEEDEVLTVVLGDDAEDPRSFLVITRLDDDNASVDDGIGLLTEDAKYEMSGVISEVILSLNSLEVVVKTEFTDFFGCSSIVADFLPRSNELSINYLNLRKWLHDIFEGSEVNCVLINE